MTSSNSYLLKVIQEVIESKKTQYVEIKTADGNKSKLKIYWDGKAKVEVLYKNHGITINKNVNKK